MCDQAADELNKTTLSESAKPHTSLWAFTNLRHFTQTTTCPDVPKTRTDYFWDFSSVATGKVAAMADHSELGCQTLCAT